MIKAPCCKSVMMKAKKQRFSVCRICKMRRLQVESKMEEEFSESKEKGRSQKAHVFCGLSHLPRMGWDQICPKAKKQKDRVDESRSDRTWAKGLSELRQICTVESVEALESFKVSVKYYSDFFKSSNFKEEEVLWKICNRGKGKRERAKRGVDSDATVDGSDLMKNKAICFAFGRSLSFPRSNHEAVNAWKLKSLSSMGSEKHSFSSASRSCAPKLCSAHDFSVKKQVDRESEERFNAQQRKEVDPDKPSRRSSQNAKIGSYLELKICEGKLTDRQKQELTAEETKCIREELHAREIFARSKSKPTHLQTIAESNGDIYPAADPSSEFLQQTSGFDKFTAKCENLPALSIEISTVFNHTATPCSAKDFSEESKSEMFCRRSNRDKFLSDSVESFTNFSAFEAADRAGALLCPAVDSMPSSENQTPLSRSCHSQVASSPESAERISWPDPIESLTRSHPHSRVRRRLESSSEKCQISLEIQKAAATSPARSSNGNADGLEDMDRAETEASSKLAESAAYRHGNMRYGATEGFLWFSFYLDGSEEVLMAETTKLDTDRCRQMHEPLIRFFSFKEKSNARAGWKRWLRKKDTIKNLGSMEITGRFLSDINPHGKEENALELQFVLLSDSAKVSASSSDIPTTHVAYSGPWGRITGRSALLFQKSSSCPSSPTFSKPSIPQKVVDLKMNCLNFSKDSSQRIPSSAPYDSDDARRNVRAMGRAFCEKNQPDFYLNQELLAMALRVPIQKQSRTTDCRGKTHLCIESQKNRTYQNSNLTSKSLENQNCLKSSEDFGNLEGYVADADNRYLTFTVILPAGEHGCPGWGAEGPPPLIQRWRSGGRCDCGSWDLGCGLILLSNDQQNKNKICKSGSTQNKPQQQMQEDLQLEMHVQGKKELAAMSLSHLTGHHISLNFREPLSSLQAFATAVAFYYGKLEPALLTSKMTKCKGFRAKPQHVAKSSYSWGISDPTINGGFYKNSFIPHSNGSHGDDSFNTVERI